MKKYILLLTASLTLTVAQGQVMFQKIYGSLYGSDLGQSIQPTSDGGYIIAGYSSGFTGGDEGYLIKIDSNGDTLWSRLWGNLKGGRNVDHILSVQQTIDGGYALIGDSWKSSSGAQYHICLIKTDSNGDTLWTKSYTDSNSYATSIRQTFDGGFIIVGGIPSITMNGNVYLIKTNSIGDTLWTKSIGDTSYEVGSCINQTTDGGFIIVGHRQKNVSALNTDDILLIKTNSNGDTLWTKMYGGTKNDRGKSVQQTNDGGFILTGYTESFNTIMQAYLIKTNSIGDTLWTKIISNPNSIGATSNSVVQTADNGYAIAGYHANNSTQMADVYLVKTNSNGDTLWTKQYGGTENDWAISLCQTTDKGFIMVGSTDSYGILYNHFYVVKTDSMGNTNTYVGVTEQYDKETIHLNILPNPFSNQTTLQTATPLKNVSLTVYNSVGQTVRHIDNFSGQTVLLQRDNLSSGLYFVRLTQDGTTISADKFVIVDE